MKHACLFLIYCALALPPSSSNAAVYFQPSGGWTYFYNGAADSGISTAALDGTWNHNNGSDEWDESFRGAFEGQIGGIEAFGGILTLEDASNLSTGTSNNRRLYLTRDVRQDGIAATTLLDTGITLCFRARLTPTDSKSEVAMPNGYGIYNDGRGMFGARQSGGAAGVISFSLTGVTNNGASDTPAYNVGQAGLVMNRRNGDVPGINVDINEAGTLNLLPLDPNQWHEFWITIQANDSTVGNGTHLVRVYVDGSLTPADFNVTAGSGSDTGATNYIALGLNNSTSLGAFDVDFFAYKPGVLTPASGFNDNFANRIVLSGTNVTTGGSNFTAGDEPNEPEHSALPDAQRGSRRTLWWSWTAATSNAVAISVTRTNLEDFPSPMLAIWTGNTLGTLTSVASNFSGVAQSRLVIAPVAGTTYHFAVDDNGNSLGDDGIRFRLDLRVFEPPANDAFASRALIPGFQLDTTASFLGATRQAGEQAHGPSTYPQTLWWTWTAPAGVLTNRVTLHADSVSYPPDMTVYTGGSFPLAAVSGTGFQNNAFGMTRVLSFLAVPGTTYQVAVAGRQTDPLPNAPSDRYGEFRLRFNASTLAMLITNRTGLTNQDFVSPFFETTLLTNGLRIENWGNATSRPVRVRLEAIPGYSAKGDAAAPALPASSNLFTSVAQLVPKAQSISLLATGRCPAPYNPDFDFDKGIGWGVYAVLEEQVGTAWFAVDHQLAGFGLWPDVGGFPGPGGGVIRVDPQLAGGTLCIPVLQQMLINGPGMITESTTVNLSATAQFNCPSNITFTSTLWSVSHPAASITTNGVLRVGGLVSNIQLTVTCPFEYRGVISNATRVLILSNQPSPFIATRARLPNGNFQMSGSGVSNRVHAVEASTNLCCASNWVTLLPTNIVATNGIWAFVDTNAPGRPRRFYRVREWDP